MLVDKQLLGALHSVGAVIHWNHNATKNLCVSVVAGPEVIATGAWNTSDHRFDGDVISEFLEDAYKYMIEDGYEQRSVRANQVPDGLALDQINALCRNETTWDWRGFWKAPEVAKPVKTDSFDAPVMTAKELSTLWFCGAEITFRQRLDRCPVVYEGTISIDGEIWGEIWIEQGRTIGPDLLYPFQAAVEKLSSPPKGLTAWRALSQRDLIQLAAQRDVWEKHDLWVSGIGAPVCDPDTQTNIRGKTWAELAEGRERMNRYEPKVSVNEDLDPTYVVMDGYRFEHIDAGTPKKRVWSMSGERFIELRPGYSAAETLDLELADERHKRKRQAADFKAQSERIQGDYSPSNTLKSDILGVLKPIAVEAYGPYATIHVMSLDYDGHEGEVTVYDEDGDAQHMLPYCAVAAPKQLRDELRERRDRFDKALE
jgi:hypothetical protein